MKLKHSADHLKTLWVNSENPVDFFNIVDIELIDDAELKIMCRTALYSLHAINDYFKALQEKNSDLSNLKF